MYVSIYVYRSPLCDCCVHETVSSEPRWEASQMSSIFPTVRANLLCSQLCSRVLSLGWWTIPGPFTIDSSGNRTSDHHVTGRGNLLAEEFIANCRSVSLAGSQKVQLQTQEIFNWQAKPRQPPNCPLNLGCYTLVLQGMYASTPLLSDLLQCVRDMIAFVFKFYTLFTHSLVA